MKKDRKIWLWLSGAFMALILFLAFVPVSFAQNSGKNSQYGMIFDEMMRFIKSYYVEDVDEKTLFEGAMKGMFEAIGDPYSVFMTEKEMDALSDTTTGQFGGVGLYISKHYGDTSFDQEHLPYVRVVAPIEDTPAYRLGIHAGDYIIKVGDKSTETMALDEVTEMLRGEGIEAVLMTPGMLCSHGVKGFGGFWWFVHKYYESLQKSGKMDAYVQGMRDVAFELKVPLADAYAEWKELEQKGVDTTALLVNGMNHPNADMHKIFADKLFTLIFEE